MHESARNSANRAHPWTIDFSQFGTNWVVFFFDHFHLLDKKSTFNIINFSFDFFPSVLFWITSLNKTDFNFSTR